MPPRHFLDLDQLPKATLRQIIEDSKARKAARAQGAETPSLQGKTLALIFEKPSTRTRVSFEVAMRQLGGDVVVLDSKQLQLGRGETVADTARVLSRYVDAIMIRTTGHEKLMALAEHATVPVINGLTDKTHPCQLMADVMTFEEHRGAIAGKKVAWSGDGNNVASTWVQAASQFDFTLDIACPEPLSPDAEILAWAHAQQAQVTVTRDPYQAVEKADCVVADTWISMGSEGRVSNPHNLLKPYQVTAELMAAANDDAIFMHCLPAHRGHEMTAEVIDGPQSVVWDEAENRLHAQKGILAWCLLE